MLQASVRYEGDSKFVGSDQEWGLFPSISAAWRINKETFMEGLTFIDDLKLRAGYGVTGISPSQYYQTVARLKKIWAQGIRFITMENGLPPLGQPIT